MAKLAAMFALFSCAIALVAYAIFAVYVFFEEIWRWIRREYENRKK